jgi:uncharacterized protein YrrD
MQTAGAMAGLAVVGEGSGDRLGRVQDVLFDQSSGRVTGFLVHPGGLFAKLQVLPRLYVRSIGTDALLVEPGKVLEEAKGEPIVEGSLSAHSLDGRPVLDDTGKYLGKVGDVLVDESGPSVSALLLDTGLIAGVLHGKPRIPFGVVKAFGQDSIVVPASYDITAAHSQH